MRCTLYGSRFLLWGSMKGSLIRRNVAGVTNPLALEAVTTPDLGPKLAIAEVSPLGLGVARALSLEKVRPYVQPEEEAPTKLFGASTCGARLKLEMAGKESDSLVGSDFTIPPLPVLSKKRGWGGASHPAVDSGVGAPGAPKARLSLEGKDIAAQPMALTAVGASKQVRGEPHVAGVGVAPFSIVNNRKRTTGVAMLTFNKLGDVTRIDDMPNTLKPLDPSYRGHWARRFSGRKPSLVLSKVGTGSFAAQEEARAVERRKQEDIRKFMGPGLGSL